MLLSHEKKFIYMKTIKTAGTSVEVALEPYCKPPAAQIAHDTDEHVSDYGIVGKRGTGQGEAYYNHMPAAQVRQKIGAEIWERYTKLCVIRNPFDKVVSYFWMQCAPTLRKEIAEREFSFAREVFRHWMLVKPALPNDRNVYCLAGEPALDRYLRYETLEQDYAVLCRDLDLEQETLPRLKSGPRLFKEHGYRDYYTRDVAGVVLRSYDREFGWFGYAEDSWR
ncbi:hypothetical protein [Salipiger abyssi]|uniref:hypothetical protein n=1 Tax=Salipiger abyssi TaxID=1250539 RepID=UPI001A8C15D6|nr:hypothetical protein [Salipiger abyssi]MBN9889849.1 hypothetical protein [Salipiger abyssi]